jgi:FkbM family methyltransferase
MPILRSEALRPVRRAAIQVLDRAPLRVVVELRGGGRMLVDLSSGVGREIWLTGQFEPEVVAAVTRILRSGDAFLDVGANCGFFSVTASRLVGPRGNVVSVDMHHEALDVLRCTRKRFELSNITILEVAVGASAGLAHVDAQTDHAYSRLGEGATVAGPAVPMVRLDDVLPANVRSNLRLVKMDIEGSEPGALDGAKEILTRLRPRVIMEVGTANLAHFSYSVEDVFSRMRSLNYRCCTLDETRVLAPEEVGGQLYNVLFVPN